MRRLRSLAQGLRRLEESAAIALVIAIAAVINLQVFCRYVLDSPLIWPEEISRLGLIWLTYIAAASCTARGSHVRVDTLLLALTPSRRRGLESVIDLILLLCFGTLAWFGWRLAGSLAGMETAAVELPMSMLIWPLVIGCALSSFHSGARILLRHFDEDEITVAIGAGT